MASYMIVFQVDTDEFDLPIDVLQEFQDFSDENIWDKFGDSPGFRIGSGFVIPGDVPRELLDKADEYHDDPMSSPGKYKNPNPLPDDFPSL